MLGPLEIAVTIGTAERIVLLAWFFFRPERAQEAEIRGGIHEVTIAAVRSAAHIRGSR